MLKKGLIILSLTTFFVANHADAKEAHHKVGKCHSKHHKVESHKVEKTTSFGCKDTGKHGTQYIPPFYDQ